jgi:hypothetical protein
MNALLRLMLFAAAMWIAFGGETSLAGAHVVTRLALVILFTAVAIVLGEVAQQREHMGMLLKLMRAGAPSRRDDKEAIDILLQGLSAKDASTRDRAYHHLKRLTGQDLPAEPALWQAWWAANRDAFQAQPTPSP